MTASRTVGNGATMPIMSVRLKSAFNRATLIPLAFDSMTTSNQSYLAQLVVGGTLTGAVFAPTTGAATEFDVSATVITGGTVIASALSSAAGSRTAGETLAGELVAAANIAGTTDIVSLVVVALTGNTTCFGELSWKEIY